NILWRNIASPNVALWAHIIRRAERLVATVAERKDFAACLAAKYHSRLSTEALMVNELYLAVLYRPVTTLATGVVAQLLSRTQPEAARLELADSLDACAKLGQALLASLARYEPERLGVYRSRKVWCSSILEYFGLLVNGEWQRVPVPRGPLNEALAT